MLYDILQHEMPQLTMMDILQKEFDNIDTEATYYLRLGILVILRANLANNSPCTMTGTSIIQAGKFTVARG